LATSRRVLVASPGYLARAGTPADAAALEGQSGIIYTKRGVADRRFPGAAGTVIVRAEAALRVNHGDMMRDAAIAGLGIALLPMFVVHAAVA
ncbi:LysR substrate-binding domain-containing protein, partial [Acinetobacter baumannii]